MLILSSSFPDDMGNVKSSEEEEERLERRRKEEEELKKQETKDRRRKEERQKRKEQNEWTFEKKKIEEKEKLDHFQEVRHRKHDDAEWDRKMDDRKQFGGRKGRKKDLFVQKTPGTQWKREEEKRKRHDDFKFGSKQDWRVGRR